MGIVGALANNCDDPVRSGGHKSLYKFLLKGPHLVEVPVGWGPTVGQGPTVGRGPTVGKVPQLVEVLQLVRSHSW